MPAKKRTTKKRKFSPAQLAAQRRFALMAKTRAKAAKKKGSRKPLKRNKTIITKPKKVVVLNPKKGKLGDPVSITAAQLRAYDAGFRDLMRAASDMGTVNISPAPGLMSQHGYEKFYRQGWNDAKIGESGKHRYKKNPTKSTRRKYRNGYLDLVIMGQAKKTPDGWLLGGKKFAQGKGIVPASRKGYYLDKATGTVFAKRERNAAMYRDESGQLRPIRSGQEARYSTKGGTRKLKGYKKSRKAYKPKLYGEKSTYSTKKSAKRAAQSKRLKASIVQRKSTTSRLASRHLSRSSGILKRRRSNPKTVQEWAKDAVWVIENDLKNKRPPSDWLRWMRANVPTNMQKAVYEATQEIIRRKQRNPSVKSIRKKFAGTLGKASQVFAPIGTPKNVAKLGKLVLIETERATIKPSGIVYLCADSRGKLHLCGSKNAPLYSGPAQSFGQVKKVEYETAKPHLYPGQGTIQFWHRMGENGGSKPTLYGDGKGGLRFRGGSYKIQREGITG